MVKLPTTVHEFIGVASLTCTKGLHVGIKTPNRLRIDCTVILVPRRVGVTSKETISTSYTPCTR
jgi:hypothetical protein